MSWKRVKLGDVCVIERGGSPRPIDKYITDSQDGVNWIKIGDTSDSMFITSTAQKITKEGMKKSRYVKSGDFLLSNSMSFGRPYILKIDGCIHDGWLVLRDTNNLFDKHFLYYYLCAPTTYEMFKSMAVGGVVNNLNSEMVRGVDVPIPPIEEQKNIAAVLDKVSDLIALRKQQLAKLDELVKARFVEMFGDTFSNPMGWEQIPFKKASTRLSDGPFGSNLKSEHYSEGGVRVIRLGNIGVGRFIDEDKSFIPKAHYEKLKKYTCRAGEIVIGTLGEPNLRACIIPEEIGLAVNKADCVHYIPRPELLDTQFVCQYINCPETLMLVQGMIHGQTRSRVSSGQIAEMPIYVPPIELQKQFSAFAAQVDESKSVIQQGLDTLETLKAALMQEYFG